MRILVNVHASESIGNQIVEIQFDMYNHLK